jgi:tyrosyl-tRNA synthetase
MAAHHAAPEQRSAQRELAAEMTRRIHGPEALAGAEQAAAALFGGGPNGETDRTTRLLAAEMPEVVIPAQEFGTGLPIADVLLRAGLASSKADARRGIEGKGYYVNERQLTDPAGTLALDELPEADGRRMAILRKGKRNYVRLIVQ